MLLLWGWACAVVGSVFTVPQVVRLLKSRTSAGIALITWQCNTAAALAWTTHGVRAGYWNMIVPNAIIAGLSILVVGMIQVDRRLPAHRVWPFALALTAVLLGFEFFALPVVFGIACLIPQAGGQLSQSIELVREPDLRGVSASFIVLTAVVPMMWWLWGLGAGDASVLVSSTVNSLVALFNVTWLTARRRGLVAPLLARA